MPSVDHTLDIAAEPPAIIAAFFDPGGAQRTGGGVERSVTTPRLLGVYAVEWLPTTFADEVLGPLGGVLYGTIVDYRPDARVPRRRGRTGFRPRATRSGRWRCTSSCAPSPGGQRRALRVLQTGGDDSPRWKRYYDVTGAGWTGSLAALKNYLEGQRSQDGEQRAPQLPGHARRAAARPPASRDIILMNVVAVVGLRWIPRGARVDAPR